MTKKMTFEETLAYYHKVVLDDIDNHLGVDVDHYEDFTIEVSAEWICQLVDHLKKRKQWAQDDAAKITKLQPFYNTVVDAIETANATPAE